MENKEWRRMECDALTAGFRYYQRGFKTGKISNLKTIQTKWTALGSIHLQRRYTHTHTTIVRKWLCSRNEDVRIKSFPLQMQWVLPNCLFLIKVCAQLSKSPSSFAVPPFRHHRCQIHFSVTIYNIFSCFLQYIFHYSLEVAYICAKISAIVASLAGSVDNRIQQTHFHWI